MNITLHTYGITGSRRTAEGEKPGVQFCAVLEIDGRIYSQVQNIRILAGGDTLETVLVRFIPSTVEQINHTDESWKALLAREAEQA